MSIGSNSWVSAPVGLSLAAREVHVWRASLDRPLEVLRPLQKLLSNDEQARAARFRFDRDRHHFIVARGTLRLILSRYLKQPPAEIKFGYTDHGKPYLTPPIGDPTGLKFNLAHSGNLALFAFTYIGEIGVDLEEIKHEFTGDEIARRFFSAREVAALEALPAELRHRAFFNCWTRKEAFIKAKGLGLSLELDQFDVSLGPSEAPALLRTRWDENEASRWSLQAVAPGSGYVGAVALEAHDWSLTCWNSD